MPRGPDALVLRREHDDVLVRAGPLRLLPRGGRNVSGDLDPLVASPASARAHALPGKNHHDGYLLDGS